LVSGGLVSVNSKQARQEQHGIYRVVLASFFQLRMCRFIVQCVGSCVLYHQVEGWALTG